MMNIAAMNNEVSKAPKKRSARPDEVASDKLLKRLLWVYLVLLIFEGALRRWVLPSLATPLLVIRDPFALWLLILSWKRGKLVFNIYLIIMMLIGVLGIFTAALLGHGNLIVALYGARIIVLHFPMIFIIGSIFDHDDVVKVGKFFVWLAVPMTLLLIAQFYSPQSAWINKGIGSDTEGAGFGGAQGYFRAPTTFSFTNGTVVFYSLLSCFVFYFWLTPIQYVNKALLIAASVSVLMAIPFSISRSLLFSVIITIIFVLVAVSGNRKLFGRIIIASFVILVLMLVVGQLGSFQTATGALTDRFASAGEAEGGLEGTFGDRFFGAIITSVSSADQIPFFGYGEGAYTNVGNQLLTGKVVFAISEQEWGRIISELGMVLGGTVIIIRIILTFIISKAAFKTMREGEILPWLLLSNCFLLLSYGQWSQPTSLGFCVVIAGYTISAMRSPATPKTPLFESSAE
jgi:hypothetical protein